MDKTMNIQHVQMSNTLTTISITINNDMHGSNASSDIGKGLKGKTHTSTPPMQKRTTKSSTNQYDISL